MPAATILSRGASRGLEAIDAARGTLIAHATSPGSVAQDGEGRNGLYTEELLQALQIPGLEVEDVFKQVRINVSRRTDYAQIPWESSSLTGEFVLNQRSPAASQTANIGNQSELVYWQGVESSGTVDAYRLYLEQYPNGVFASLAAFRINELERQSTGTSSSASSSEESSDRKPDDALNTPPYVAAIYPPQGKSWTAGDPCVDESAITKEIRDQIYWSNGFEVHPEFNGSYASLTRQMLGETP